MQNGSDGSVSLIRAFNLLKMVDVWNRLAQKFCKLTRDTVNNNEINAALVEEYLSLVESGLDTFIKSLDHEKAVDEK